MLEGMDFVVRFVPLPLRVHGLTVLDENGLYNVYINSNQTEDIQRAAYEHELEHIRRGDFSHPEKPLDLIEAI